MIFLLKSRGLKPEIINYSAISDRNYFLQIDNLFDKQYK